MAGKCIGFLGPEGSYTSKAAQILMRQGEALQSFEAIEALFDGLSAGQVDAAIVPVENSHIGYIDKHLSMIVGSNGFISGSTLIPLNFAIYRKVGDSSTLRTLIGHPVALEQCRSFIEQQGLEIESATSSTVGLMGLVKKTEAGWGALGPAGLSLDYELSEVLSNVGEPNRATRFFRVERTRPKVVGCRHAMFVARDAKRLWEILSSIKDIELENTVIATLKSEPGIGQYRYFVEVQVASTPALSRDEALLGSESDIALVGLVSE